jgi:hypothetical protein
MQAAVLWFASPTIVATALPQYRPTRLNIELDPCIAIVVAG